MRALSIFFVVMAFATPAAAQALEDCPRYVPRTLEAWIASPDLKLAAYGYTCRMINIDTTLSQAMREGVQASDSAT